MAVLYISEYSEFAVRDGGVAIAKEPTLTASQTLAITASSAQSVAFNAATSFVRIHTDVICAIEFGTAPVALVSSPPAGSKRLAANQTEYWSVPVGAAFKVAVIATA